MISPRLFHKFISSTLNRQVKVFRKRRATAVIVHCDGNVYPPLDDMVDSGLDGWHAIELVLEDHRE